MILGEPVPGISELPLLGSNISMYAITLAYMIFVYTIGPYFMKNRNAYQLKNVILAYNLVQVVLNFLFFVFAIYHITFNKELFPDFVCLTPISDEADLKYIEVGFSYAYFLFKILDYTDTIFFVLRKSFKQITFLHVYHHVSMALASHYYMRYYGSGGQVIVMAVMNCLVHSIMYSYYFLTALKPELKKSLWWKKYITVMQMTQFVIVFIHFLSAIIFRPECKMPKLLLIGIPIQAVFFITLFSNFYINAYIKPAKKVRKE